MNNYHHSPSLFSLQRFVFFFSSVLCRQTEQLHSPSGTRTWRLPLRAVAVPGFPPEEQHPLLLWAGLPHRQQDAGVQVSPREVAAPHPLLHPRQRYRNTHLSISIGHFIEVFYIFFFLLLFFFNTQCLFRCFVFYETQKNNSHVYFYFFFLFVSPEILA